MPPYENVGDFVLFPNKKKTDKSPDFTGTVTIHGTKRKLSAWLKGDNRLSGVVGDLVDDKPRYTPHPED